MSGTQRNNLPEGFRLLRWAAEEGYPYAQYDIGVHLYFGIPCSADSAFELQSDIDQAKFWFSLFVAQCDQLMAARILSADLVRVQEEILPMYATAQAVILSNL